MRRKETSIFGAAAAALTFLAMTAAGESGKPTPIGAWFGIARPCPADPAADSALHAELCQAVCGTCPSIPGALPPEVPMMPTLVSDGTVLLDDFGGVGGGHTTAHGVWIRSREETLPDGKPRQRFQASFIWLQGSPSPGVVRPRFVTYFDPKDPDRMLGYLQYYFFPLFDPATGLVIVSPASRLDPLAGDHIPAPGVDPLAMPPPETCTQVDHCLGTYHFVIRRIKAE